MSPEVLRGLLLDAISAAMDRPVDQIDVDTPLGQMGIDSLAAADVLITMECELGRPIADELITEDVTISDLVELFRQLPPLKSSSTATAGIEILKAAKHADLTP